MAECKPSDKSATEEVDLTSISSLLNIILGVFGMIQKPARKVPPALLLIGSKLRPGMSARNLAARQIVRLKKAGIETGEVFADGPNTKVKETVGNAEEIVSTLQTEAKVDIVIPPGGIMISATGTAGPIPVVVQGANTFYATGEGGIG